MNSQDFTIPDGYTSRKIEVVGDITYVGYSQVGDADSELWRVQRVTVSGGNTTIEYAIGTWTNRVTLNYR